MNTMDNAKVMQALEKYSLQKYLENLAHAEMHKVTLFPVFPHTAAPNLSEPAEFVLIDELSKIISINSGSYQN